MHTEFCAEFGTKGTGLETQA